MSEGWKFEVYQDGVIVAEGSGPEVECVREAAHYAMIYGQDGPVTCVVKPDERMSEQCRAP